MGFKIWLKALRLPFLTATLIPVVLGSIIAWRDLGSFSWLFFFLTLAGVSFLHIGTNLANDYFDHQTGNDELNRNPTAFSGGSRVIQEGAIPPSKILRTALLSFLAGIIIGLYLVLKLRSSAILILGAIGVLCGFFYTAGPLRIGYHGIGEAVVGFCFGPLVTLGAYCVQTNRLSPAAFAASVPVGILIFLVLYINEFPDYDPDRLAGKRTLVVQLGKVKAIKVYHCLLAFTYLYIAGGILAQFLPLSAAIVLLSLPLAFKAYRISRDNFQKIYELIPANAATVKLHLFFGLLLGFSFILDKFF